MGSSGRLLQALFVLVLLAAGSAQSEPRSVCSERVPVHVSLSADAAPLLGEEGVVSALVGADYELGGVSVRIELPMGGRVLDAPEAALGKMAARSARAVPFRVIFDSPGNKFVRAVARAEEAPGVSWSAVAYLPLNVGAVRSAVGLDPAARQPDAEVVASGNGTLIGSASAESASAAAPGPPPAVSEAQAAEPLSGGGPVAGTLVVTGVWKFYDRSDALVGQRQNCVQLRRGSDGAHLAWAYTDWNGKYTFPAVSNPGSSGVYVRCFTYTSYGSPNLVSVINLSGDEWADAWRCDTGIYVLADGTQSIGTHAVPNGSLNEKAWWIKDDMTKAYSVPSDMTGRHVAEWSSTSTVGTYYITGENIHLTAGDADDTADTVLHEMGHSVMYNIYGGYMPPSDCPDPHYVRGISGPVCAWVEGWAHVWHMWTQDDPIRNYPGGGSLDLEAATWGTYGWQDGDNVEGRVAGAVWDICDSANDGYDTYDGSWNDVWDVVYNVNSNTFAQFWSSWRLRGHAKHGPVASIYQCTIDYDTPPTLGDLPNIWLDEDSFIDNAIDLWSYASDPESSDVLLNFTITLNDYPSCGVSIDSNRYVDVYPLPNWCGASTIRIVCSDGIKTAADPFVVTVNAINDAPALSPVQDILIEKGASIDNALNLHLYASDVEDYPWDLAYTITANSNPDCGVAIDSVSYSDYIDINPVPGWTGFSDITLRVTDTGGLWAEDTFRVVAAEHFDRIGQARANPNNTWVWLSNKLSTGPLEGFYYIQEADRCSGIRVASSDGPPSGTRVTVAGPLSTSYAERVLTPYITKLGSAQPAVAPLGMCNDALGGAGPDPYTQSVPQQGAGAYNVGLLVTTTGRVIQHSSGGRFYITDGGSVRDNASGTASVFVYGVPSGYRPPIGSYVSVTGISGAGTLSGKTMRILRPRGSDDIRVRLLAAAFVYDTNPAEAAWFKNLLDANSVTTTMVPLSQVTTADLGKYQVILIGSDTGPWGDPAKVSAVLAAGKPVIAVGNGGSRFLDAVASPDLYIGWANSNLAHGETRAVVRGGNIYSYPNVIPFSPGQSLDLYLNPGVDCVTLYDPGLTVTHFLDDYYYQGYTPVCAEQDRFYQWGFFGAPDKMTEWGSKLFVNLVFRTVGC